MSISPFGSSVVSAFRRTNWPNGQRRTEAIYKDGAYDGEYDKTNLPAGDLILSNYFSVRDGKIVSLIVIRNTPADY